MAYQLFSRPYYLWQLENERKTRITTSLARVGHQTRQMRSEGWRSSDSCIVMIMQRSWTDSTRTQIYVSLHSVFTLHNMHLSNLLRHSVHFHRDLLRTLLIRSLDHWLGRIRVGDSPCNHVSKPTRTHIMASSRMYQGWHIVRRHRCNTEMHRNGCKTYSQTNRQSWKCCWY